MPIPKEPLPETLQSIVQAVNNLAGTLQMVDAEAPDVVRQVLQVETALNPERQAWGEPGRRPWHFCGYDRGDALDLAVRSIRKRQDALLQLFGATGFCGTGSVSVDHTLHPDWRDRIATDTVTALVQAAGELQTQITAATGNVPERRPQSAEELVAIVGELAPAAKISDAVGFDAAPDLSDWYRKLDPVKQANVRQDIIRPGKGGARRNYDVRAAWDAISRRTLSKNQ